MNSSLAGQNLGPYENLEPIGEGGMASVYRAIQPSLHRSVAIKVLPPHFAQDPTFVDRFEREARTIAQLDHPNILPVYDFGREGDVFYLVMKYVRGQTLKDRMGRLWPPAETLPLLRQIAAALDHAHEAGVIHRDIKPGNVLIDQQGNAYLSDFGLVKTAHGSIQLTATGMVVGTPAYMSPEQAEGRPVDTRTDIYSLGVILYEMLTGRVPFQADTPMGVVIKHITEPLPPPRRFNPALPEGIEAVLSRALSKAPPDRFASAGEMVEALARAIEGGATPEVSAPPVPAPRPERALEDTTPLPAARQPAPPRPPARTPPPAVAPAAAPAPARRQPWLWWGAGLGAALLIGLVALVVAGYFAIAGRPTPTAPAATVSAAGPLSALPAETPSPTATSQATPTPEPPAGPGPTETFTPTPSPTREATSTATPTATPSPTATQTPTAVPPAENVVFFDDFDGAGLDSQRWAWNGGSGQIQVSGGAVQLAGSGRDFPWFYATANPFPAEGDFSLKVTLRYVAVHPRGVGFRLGTARAPYGTPQENAAELAAGRLIEIWQDAGNWRVAVGQENTTVFALPAPELNRQQIEIRYAGGVYRVSLNGAEIYASPPTSVRPSVLWFGNPTRLDADGVWTSLQIEQVAVEALPSEEVIRPQECALSPGETFAGAWQEFRPLLGCPLAAQQTISTIAEEVFEGGHMFWRMDTDETYVIFDRTGDGAELSEGSWRTDPAWRWDGSNPEGVGLSPPPGRVEPIRGFGWVWRTFLNGAEGPLGWALDREYGFDNTGQAQLFEQGTMFKGSSPRIYVLLKSGKFFAR